MTKNIKDYLVVAIIVTLVAASYGIVRFAGTYSRSIQPGAYRSFSVSAEGKAVAIPDVATISFTVLTEGGTDLGALQTENTEKANDAIAFVKEEGVAAKDIETQNYSVTPRYQHYSCSYDYSSDRSVEPCPPPVIVGYTVNQTVSVKVRDFDKIGAILAGVVDRGANTVSGPSFAVDDPTEIEAQARAEAVQKAKAQAREVARAGGFSIGRLISIEESTPYYYGRDMKLESATAYGMGGDSAAPPAPAIEPGSDEFIVRMYLRYEIR
ncbi:hypothetical protein A2110_02190 [Candidatus Jorgensenbacteria bacterium GWA1_54_12]|uniref:26 kDa periplasmic immunogenic protein n=1 Tax=Candidatus Jorgensenbacteria bacterium GWA1_54_12 TaxID=1798468 RepID=A0A1F6BLG5_9BACT|nr:MAG: hypothetical protein A2110_02190 [Candidatus Jorgensenbacteria bacterium GWA1_54_12]